VLKITVVEGREFLVTPQITIDRSIVTSPRKSRKHALQELAAAVKELRQDAKANGIDKMPKSEIKRPVAAGKHALKKKSKRPAK
jgi:hypothetical protein